MSRPAPAFVASPAKPFLKWAGGKRQLLQELRARVPAHYGRYFEPFIGAGALFFDQTPPDAYLSDINDELINCYLVVRDNLDALLEELGKHRYEKDYYYEIRAWDRDKDFLERPAVERAGRFIFLNRTCFNGLHRVNRKGQFNVPFGRYVRPKILDAETLSACSSALSGVTIERASFEQTLALARAGDFVYLDPPYVPLTSTASFTMYAAHGFTQENQEQLAEVCDALNAKGVHFMLSNSNVRFIEERYRSFRIETVHAARVVNANAAGRGKIQECIVTNY